MSCEVSLYILRNANRKDPFKIQAIFDNEIKLDFISYSLLSDQDDTGIFIYRLKYTLKRDDNNVLSIQHENQWKPVKFYELCIPGKMIVNVYFEASKQRAVEYPDSKVWHYALLDVNFEKSFMSNPPGSSVPFWDQLCILTYFFIQHKADDAYKDIFNQFIVLRCDNDLRRDQLHGFFRTSNNYISCIMKDSNRYVVDTEILIRMIGILLIKENNIEILYLRSNDKVPNILNSIFKHCHHVIDSVSDEDFDFFENSVAKFLCLKLWLSTKFIENTKDTSDETIELIQRIQHEKKREKVVSGMLKLLAEINNPIEGSKWTELFSLAEPNQLTFKHLNLITSIDFYLKYLVQIVSTKYLQNADRKNIIIQSVQDFVTKSHFSLNVHKEEISSVSYVSSPFNFKSIHFLLEFEQHKLKIHGQNTADIEEIIHLEIQKNDRLKEKIRDYLYETRITIEHFESVRTIINFESRSQLLYFNRGDFLREWLTKNKSESSHFYCKWFSCFIANGGYSMNDNQQRESYQLLIKQWALCFEEDVDKFDSMFTELDKLLDSFQSIPNENDKNECCKIFINHMVDICCKKELIFRLLRNGLTHVKNKCFIDAFKIKFIETVSRDTKPDDLKRLDSYENPLKRLFEISQSDKQNNSFVIDLIELLLKNVPIYENDILECAVIQPMQSTLIYHVLFHDCCQNLSIYKTVIKLMDTLWTQWEQQGIYANYVMIWKKQTKEQRTVANQMWGIIKNRDQPFEMMLEKAYIDFENKKNICEKTQICVNEYCQKACDKQKLIDEIQLIEKKLMTNNLRSVQIPESIQQIYNKVGQLISYRKCQLWQNFLKQNQDELILPSETQTSCDSILYRSAGLFDKFVNEVKKMCSNWKNQPISQSLKIFPNMHDDLDPLKEELNNDIIEFFTLLFEYKSSSNLNLICQGYLNLHNIFKIKLNDHENALNFMLHIDKNTNGAMFSEVYQNFKKHYYSFYSTNMNKLALYFGNSFKLIQFLDSVSAIDIDNLREAVNDSDDTLMNTKVTLDLVMLKTFLEKIHCEITKFKLETSQNFVLDRLRHCFESAVEPDQDKIIFECFDSCHPLVSNIELTHRSLTQRGLMKGKQILSMMNNISFNFVNLGLQANKKLFGFNYLYDVTINFNELMDLRDRARLVEYSNTIKKQNDTKQSPSVIYSFVSFVDTIENIIKNLTQLNMTGYPSIETVLELNKTFTCIDNNFDELIAYETKTGKLLVEWEYQLYELYKEHIELSYFKYDQVWGIENYLQNRTKVANNAYHLLKYIGIQPELISNDLSIDVKKDPINRLKNIGKMLSVQMHNETGTDKCEYQGNNRVLVVKTSEEGVMRAVLSLFTRVGAPVRANQLFSCTEKTTWIELKAFVYRCFYSKKFHVLIRSQLLTISIQDKFIELLIQMIKLVTDRRFQFGVIASSNETCQPLINSLQTLELLHPIYDHQMLNKNDLKKETEKFIGKNCFLVTSSMAGLGKSTFIRNRIHEARKQYLKFSIAGHIDLEPLVGRLRTSINQSSTGELAIHIDIGIVLDISKLHEFLYCILLFRNFSYGLLAINLPAEVPIYIELDSSPQMTSLYEELTILEHLQKTNISHIEWSQMKMECLPGIQLVANYLQAIQDKSISQNEIKEENLIKLDADTCSKLLREQFNLKDDENQISWTSITILVTIYSYLFLGFSHCEYFLRKHPHITQLRMDILQYLLNSSKQFTSFSVESVRKKQHSSGDGIINLDEAIIRWDKLQPFTVIFTEWNDPLFVYKNSNVVPRSLINTVVEPVQANIFYRVLFYSRLKNEQQQREQTQFPDHNQLTHKDFFMRLAALSKKYYGKPVCNNCFKQYKDTDQICTSCGTKSTLLRPET